MDKEEKEWVLVFITLTFLVFIAVILNGLENDFKTGRQICEENGGTYIEDLSSHNQNKCIYDNKLKEGK